MSSRANTRWWCEAMDHGIAAAVPGRRHVGSLPRHQQRAGGAKATANTAIRRISAGAATASASPRCVPGDVALDNATVLEPDMLFMIHPNQYLPETGYLLCGEPVVMTAHGAEPLTAQKAALAMVEG